MDAEEDERGEEASAERLEREQRFGVATGAVGEEGIRHEQERQQGREGSGVHQAEGRGDERLSSADRRKDQVQGHGDGNVDRDDHHPGNQAEVEPGSCVGDVLGGRSGVTGDEHRLQGERPEHAEHDE